MKRLCVAAMALCLLQGALRGDEANLKNVQMPPHELISADPQILLVSPLAAQGGEEVVGFRVWFFGFEFTLLMAHITPGVPTVFDDAVYRPAGIRAVGSNVQIAFDWRDGPQSPDVVLKYVRP